MDVSMEYCHGAGVRRAPFIRAERGAGFDVMRRVKRALDPHDDLNPGKLDLSRQARPARTAADTRSRNTRYNSERGHRGTIARESRLSNDRCHGRVTIIAMLIVAAVISAACNGGSKSVASDATSGSVRSFMMGFSTTPRALNGTAYAETFKLAAQYGELVLIQRTPKWSDFAPGAAVSDETAQTTASEKKSISDRNLHLFFAIDPTDSSTGRDRLADLPSSLSARNFGDADVRAAFISYAEYVALNYHPAYLALGVDMNEYYEKNAADFENFKTLYAQTYDAVKQISPETQITVTFQWEDLLGLLPTQDTHYADWQLLRAFDPRLDIMTISTYPSLAFSSASAIPRNYYSQLRVFTKKPIAIAAMGYASTTAAGQKGGSDDGQAAFVRRVLSDAESMGMPFIVWFAAWDPSFAKDSAQSAFQSIGLLREDGSDKPAWSDWSAAAQRRYRPPDRLPDETNQ